MQTRGSTSPFAAATHLLFPAPAAGMLVLRRPFLLFPAPIGSFRCTARSLGPVRTVAAVMLVLRRPFLHLQERRPNEAHQCAPNEARNSITSTHPPSFASQRLVPGYPVFRSRLFPQGSEARFCRIFSCTVSRTERALLGEEHIFLLRLPCFLIFVAVSVQN